MTAANLQRLETAKKIGSGKTFSGNYSTYGNVIDVPSEKGQLKHAIDILRTLEDDWNGHGAPVPHPKALDTAQLLIEFIPFGRKYPNKIYPGTDRTIAIEWSNRTDGDILMSIEPYRIGAIRIFEDGRIEDLGNFDLLPDTATCPQTIISVLPKE